MDTALACYRQLFATGNETLYDLADIAAEWRRYRAMMTHWRQVAPGAVVDVSYEALTEDPKAIIPRLVADICGLPWSEDCLRFHENTRAVRTASASQVRQPMTRASVDRWRQYETHLTPLIHALRNEARTLADG
jgi:LPS sulfotransferase NodH